MIDYENLAKANNIFIKDIKKKVLESIDSGWYILGNEVHNFEKSYSEYCGINHCVGVASGLDALIISLASFNFKNGDEIIVASNTYIATILAIVHNNLKPILVEPDINTYNIDPSLIEDKITKNTKAILVTHLYGKPCKMDPILEICNKYNLRLIEDCAQAHGALYKNKMVGTFGNYGAYSFYPTKNLGAMGDAGAIICDSDEAYEKLIRLRNYGSSKKYVFDEIGYNSRLDELQAAILNVKLKSLNSIIEHKRKIAEIYLQNLNQNFILPIVENFSYDVYHIFNIRVNKRDKLQEYLLSNNIKTEIHYPIPPHRQKALKGIIDEDSFPISEEIHATTLSLPISYAHSIDEIYHVIEVLNKF